MSLKFELIESIFTERPLIATILEGVDISYEHHPLNPTIHIHELPGKTYQFEQIESNNVWPYVHEKLCSLFNQHVTMNFKRL